MTPGNPARRIEHLFDQVWDTLDLPTPRVRRFEDRWQWLRWEEMEAYSRRHSDSIACWVFWDFLYPRDPKHTVADPEWDARLRRWKELKSQDQPDAEPAFSEVMALRALDFLREIEERCRDSGRTEELAVCLTVQAVLLGRALGQEEVAQQLSEAARALGEGEEGWRVRAAVEQVLRFLNGEGSAGDYMGDVFPKP